HLYKNARTRIGDQEAAFKSKILQGDPLSGYLFNFVLDWVLDVASTPHLWGKETQYELEQRMWKPSSSLTTLCSSAGMWGDSRS
ncbi:Zgc:194878, partial [Caligus rogercresseyi]